MYMQHSYMSTIKAGSVYLRIPNHMYICMYIVWHSLAGSDASSLTQVLGLSTIDD